MMSIFMVVEYTHAACTVHCMVHIAHQSYACNSQPPCCAAYLDEGRCVGSAAAAFKCGLPLRFLRLVELWAAVSEYPMQGAHSCVCGNSAA
jgi:hypothetical protein